MGSKEGVFLLPLQNALVYLPVARVSQGLEDDHRRDQKLLQREEEQVGSTKANTNVEEEGRKEGEKGKKEGKSRG